MNKVIFGLLVILTTALMGSSFAIGKIGLAYTSPMLLAAIRFILAGLIMAIIVKLIKRPHPSKTIDCAKLAIIGLFQTAGVMGCIFVGLMTISAGELSILTFMNPLLVIIFGTLFCKTRYAPQQWAGVFLGFIGVFITMGAHLDLKNRNPSRIDVSHFLVPRHPVDEKLGTRNRHLGHVSLSNALRRVTAANWLLSF